MSNSDLFNRIEYKFNAKQRLNNAWTTPILISLIYFALEAILGIKPLVTSVQTMQNFSFSTTTNITTTTSNYDFGFLISIIIEGILGIASAKFYLLMSKTTGPMKFSTFLDALNLWAKGLLGFLWTTLWTVLWSLLFIVPGIIKAIAYSQIFYILAENPNITVTEALKVSMKITKGYKSDIFVMYLSFIGWGLLCCLSCGIGFLWLMPYMNLTFANAYHFLIKNSLDKNRISQDELDGKRNFSTNSNPNSDNTENVNSNTETSANTETSTNTDDNNNSAN